MWSDKAKATIFKSVQTHVLRIDGSAHPPKGTMPRLKIPGGRTMIWAVLQHR